MVDGGRSEGDANGDGDEARTNVVEGSVYTAIVVRLAAAAAMSDVVKRVPSGCAAVSLVYVQVALELPIGMRTTMGLTLSWCSL